MTQRPPHCQSPPRHGWRPMKAGNLECAVLPTGSSTGWRVSSAGSSEGLNLPRQQSGPLPLPGSSACLRVSQQSIRLIYPWEEEILENSFSFRDFLMLLSCLLPELNECPCWVEWFTSTQIILLPHSPLKTLQLKEPASKMDILSQRKLLHSTPLPVFMLIGFSFL